MSIIPNFPIPLKIYRMPLAGLDGPVFIDTDCLIGLELVVFLSDHRIGGRARISGVFRNTCLAVLSTSIEKPTFVFQRVVSNFNNAISVSLMYSI